MKIKGNYLLMFLLEILSGILTYYFCTTFGLVGIAYGFIPFMAALILVQSGHKPDERELSIVHKSNSYSGILIAIILAIVYMFFPSLNWFFVYVSALGLVRGVIGTFLILLT